MIILDQSRESLPPLGRDQNNTPLMSIKVAALHSASSSKESKKRKGDSEGPRRINLKSFLFVPRKINMSSLDFGRPTQQFDQTYRLNSGERFNVPERTFLNGDKRLNLKPWDDL